MKANRYYWLSSANKENCTGSGNHARLHIVIPSSQLVNWNPGELHKAETAWLGEGLLQGDFAVVSRKLYDSLENREHLSVTRY
ncbi:hypothetical protein [Niallia sp. Man26]|uniref:hypothetical protein n=1 Tax=Niallia sp. Man26 TaxID=2912824 RepID=UPI001ED9E7DE|nr:hypothetical protein [Niallia sp. Man26]UPO91079.1 hypothetical protein L8T27_026335 [Niallia sp. Man26]